MAQCKDCIHNDICQLYKELGVKILCYPCGNYKSADVVPKSEVEKLNNKLMIWKQDRFNLYQRLELYKMAREKVAREIFEEIDKVLNFYKKYNPYNDLLKCVIDRIAELKKKYTENKGE